MRYLGWGLKSAREEIRKLKAVSGSISLIEQGNLNKWNNPKNFKCRSHRFCAADASEYCLRNRFGAL
jgi:hypothetical protein